MENLTTVEPRLKNVAELIQQYLDGNLSARESFSKDGDLLDIVIANLHRLADKISRSGQLIANYEERVTAIMNILLRYTILDFSQKAQISSNGDEIDAIALALNTLGEELNDRITAEREHTRELEKLAIVIETTADAVIALSPEGEITLWNKSAERIFGFKATEVIGRSALTGFYPADETTAIRQMFLKVRNGEQIINAHSRRSRKDGTVVDVSITMTPVFDDKGNLISISALARDITVEKRAEAALRENEERFRSLLESVKDYAIITLDAQGRVTFWNKGAEDMKGYKAEEVQGKNFSSFFSEEDRLAGIPDKLLKEAKEYGKATFEGPRLKKDGGYFLGYVVLTCLHDTQGRIIGYSKITRDLTESKKKDQAILESHLRLEQKNEELERMNKELASFAYVSSHDLQEPLRKIQTFAGRILDTDYVNLSPQGKNFFQRLTNSAQRMQQLILDILTYSRVTTTDSLKEVCDLAAIATSVKEEFREQLEEANASFIISELPTVPAIAFQIKQLFSNLLSNAIKFRALEAKPMITLTGKIVAGSELPIKLSRPGKYYCHLQFTDNGIGFEPHFSKQIFEVFQRLHNQEIYKGTGIGLAICKKITENHFGAIVADAKPGEGATFHIFLPTE